jgi:hypothetical protein
VAVLAAGFHEIGTQLAQVTEEPPCHPSDDQEEMSEPIASDGNGCDLPCCAEMDCVQQGACVLHYSSAVLLINQLKIFHYISYRSRANSIILVPEVDIPPDNPPPIHG